METQLTELVSGFSVRDYLQDIRSIYSRGPSEMMGYLISMPVQPVQSQPISL